MTAETAYVLPEAVTASPEPQVFAGFPGRWEIGVPIPVSALGLTEAEADATIAERGLPIVKRAATSSASKKAAKE